VTSQDGPEMKRKLSRREKKELKKQEKLKSGKRKDSSNAADVETGVAAKLYTGSVFLSNSFEVAETFVRITSFLLLSVTFLMTFVLTTFYGICCNDILQQIFSNLIIPATFFYNLSSSIFCSYKL